MRNNVRNNIRNYVRNYTVAFLGIVPIEIGQAILPVPWILNLIKRYKYEFLPHTILTSVRKNAILSLKRCKYEFSTHDEVCHD